MISKPSCADASLNCLMSVKAQTTRYAIQDAFLGAFGICLMQSPWWLRRGLGRPQTFFDDIRALTHSMVFDSWHHLMDFMLSELELHSKLATC
jgi:hypothetical protein